MGLSKLWSGFYLLYCYLSGSLLGLAREFRAGPAAGCRELYRCGVRTALGARTILFILLRKEGGARLVQLCQEVQTDRDKLFRHPVGAYFLVQPLLEKQQFEKVIDILTPLAEPKPERGKCYGARGMAYLQLGRYQEALADLTRCHELAPRASTACGFNPQRAFLHGLNGNVEAARAAMLAQLNLPPTENPGRELARFLHHRLAPLVHNLGLRGSVGVFLSSNQNALGHAILDPFHQINLFGAQFDNLLMVHPDLTGYSPATRLTLSILEQYVETVFCDDPEILNFAWQHLGELRHENFTFLLCNYWALNRRMFAARQDATHPLHQGRTYLRPSPKIVSRAEALLERNQVDLSGPLVIVHSREHGYHELRGQTFRNTEARNYVPALRKLVSLGYRVVRVGDRKMASLRREVPGLVELPMTDLYSPVLDPYLISRCEFMISCQSGPCSYARVFGRPNLVANAAYHYTLLPEHRELLAFKSYRRTGTKQLLSVEEILQAGIHLFDRTQHFIDQGIETEDMTAEEIEASVDEMLEWLREPNRPEKPAQREFRRLMSHYGTKKDLPFPLATPMADYIGYALPECRVSAAVAALRPGYLPVNESAAPLAVQPRVAAA